jgi:LmbE family N-acetylglucosaminyl deacetylase
MITPEVIAMLKSIRRRFFAVAVHCVVRPACLLAIVLCPALGAQNEPLRLIAFGAHPDDCDLGAGGLAAKYATLGYKVKFVSLTNGDAGHQSQGGEELAKRRRAEAHEAGRRIGIEYEVLANHDGKLLPTLDVREQVIREIRQWKADIVIAPRPNDYHPDHRYVSPLRKRFVGYFRFSPTKWPVREWFAGLYQLISWCCIDRLNSQRLPEK